MREAILGLTSPVTPERGLVGALEEYGARYAAAAKIAVAVESSPEATAVDLSAETEAQVFRIVQEALTNVRKHANAARVEIEVACRGAELEVRVTDDGRGMRAAGRRGERARRPGRSSGWRPCASGPRPSAGRWRSVPVDWRRHAGDRCGSRWRPRSPGRRRRGRGGPA